MTLRLHAALLAAAGVRAGALAHTDDGRERRSARAAKDYGALRWSDYIEQVEREGRSAATPTGGNTRQRE